MFVEEDGEKSLQDAEQRLAAFEAKASPLHRMARFRRESPRHPILLGMGLSALIALLCGVTGVMLAVAPILSADLARTFARTPLLTVAPLGLVGVAVVAVVAWVGLRVLASARAANSPLLPRDQSEQNRLRSEVQRLKAAREVSKRLSATPPPARMRGPY